MTRSGCRPTVLLVAGILSAIIASWSAGHGQMRSAAAMAAPTPTAAPGYLLPPIYYQGGTTVYAVNRDGSGATAVVQLPTGTTFQPILLPDGRLLYPTGGGFAVVDRYGRHDGIRMPDLNPGESVWSVAPSPDDRTLAWQLFAPLQLQGYTANTGNARIVLTGRFGDAGTAIMTAQARSDDGQVPVLLGWRPSSPYSLNGPTLLLQDLYSANDAARGVLANAARGLLEYDPSIDDMVNDYLPAVGAASVPAQRALAVSADGTWTVYGDSNTFMPSGEGPLARVIDVLNLNTNALRRIDDARHYPTKGMFVSVTRRKVRKRTVTHQVTTRLHLYQYFSHHAYVAPGDGRLLYTLLTVSYPPGALVPRVQGKVLVATMDGRTRAVVATAAQAQGWLDGHVAVIAKADGLYAVDVVFGGFTKLASGANLRFIGTR